MAEKLSVSQIRNKIAEDDSATWVAGETPLTKLAEHRQNMHLGLKVPPGESERIESELSSITTEIRAFAPERDWRSVDNKNWITSIKDQGDCGSCVSFATVATIEAQARIEHKEPTWNVDLAEAELFFCGAGRACGQGWWPTNALQYATSTGVAEETCFPYQDHDMDCNTCSDRADRLLKVGSWDEVVGINQRKGWLDTNGPMIACMAVYRDFFAYKRGVYRHVAGELAGYHAVSCIGYSEEEDCWICKNSWGEQWGDGGFFKIAYGEAEMDTRFAMYGVAGITGTLLPDIVDEGTEMADYVVIEDGAAGSPVLFAYVKDKWRHMEITRGRLAALGQIAFASSSLAVTYKGDEIVSLRAWKKF